VGLGTLRFLTVKEWQDKVESGEDIVTKSRYVSARVRHVVQGGDVRKLKTLWYLLLLLDWSRCLKPGTKGGKRVPIKEELKTAIDGVGSELLDGVGKRFAEGTYAYPVIDFFHETWRLTICYPVNWTNGTWTTSQPTSAPLPSQSTTSPPTSAISATTSGSKLKSKHLPSYNPLPLLSIHQHPPPKNPLLQLPNLTTNPPRLPARPNTSTKSAAKSLPPPSRSAQR